MKQKILVTGFPHCGTSILKSIVGHVPGVQEEYNETYDMPQKEGTWVFKYPIVDEFMIHRKDCVKIFIIRNPLWVMSSLNKRFNYAPPDGCTLHNYVQTLELFKKYKENPVEGLYLLRYEDMFENNFAILREIFDSIGLEYKDEIFDNSGYQNVINKDSYEFIEQKPPCEQQGQYRNWQINQKFVNNNFPEKIDLVKFQIEFIKNNSIIHEIYPNISANLLEIL